MFFVCCHRTYAKIQYAIVFVLTSTSKYAYIHYPRIYMEIRSYLV